MKVFKTLIFFFFLFFISAGNSFSQIPPPVVDCNKTDRPEFHSLRPYQASPCSDSVGGAIYCGDTLIFNEKVSSQPNDCVSSKAGYHCNYTVKVEKTVGIALSNAEFPILGNTEDYANSQAQNDVQDDDRDDVTKVNEYVSWYLNGSLDRAEYPFTDLTDPKDVFRVVNFSGPIKKLLSFETQILKRLETIDKAKNSQHNEDIACTVAGIPVPCYIASIPRVIMGKHRLTDFGEHKPPVRSDYKDFTRYWLDYKRWRGNICIIVKNVMFCFPSPLKPDYWSNLFSYIPFSSTEDRKGSEEVKSVDVSSPDSGVIISDVKFENPQPAILYFAHTDEVAELSEILQTTYVPKGVSSTDSPSDSACTTVNVRANPGDNLFPGEITGDLSYTADFSCNFGPYETDFSCEKDINVSFTLITKTPRASEIYSNLVNGSTAVFKRIYPKIGPGGVLECMADMPGVSTVDYTPTNLNPPQSGQLYFAHMGSVYEYFLKGIQTALRPKGYGEQVISGQDCSSLLCNDGKIGVVPPLPAAGKCKLGGNTLGLPPSLIKATEAAAQSFNVPAALMIGIMYGEGAFNPGGQFLDEGFVAEHLKECVLLPGCDPNGSVINNIVPFFPQYWEDIKDAVKVVDPEREPNACNLLDGIFALAKDLSQGQNGDSSFSGKKCFGINLNSGGGGSSSCPWDDSDAETAIRVWEFGTAYEENSLSCATKENSCLLGGGLAAQCPTGDDTCEKINLRYSNPSHNGCIWDVYNSNK